MRRIELPILPRVRGTMMRRVLLVLPGLSLFNVATRRRVVPVLPVNVVRMRRIELLRLWEKPIERGTMRRVVNLSLCVRKMRMLRVVDPFFGRNRERGAPALTPEVSLKVDISVNFEQFCHF